MIGGSELLPGCYESVLGRKGRLILQLGKVMGYCPNLFVTWDSIIDVVLHTMFFE